MPGKSEKVKSKAQLRWAFAAEDRGELEPGTAKRWAKKVNVKKLPEEVKQGALVAYSLGHFLYKRAMEEKYEKETPLKVEQEIPEDNPSDDTPKTVVDNLSNSSNPVNDLQKMLRELPEEKFVKRKKKQNPLLMSSIFWGAPRQRQPWNYIL